MSLFCTYPNCAEPVNRIAGSLDNEALQRLHGITCAACGMPLILNDRYLPYQLLAKGGFAAAYLAIDALDPGLRPCVVKQLQPNPRLGEHQVQLAQTLFQREAIVLEQLGVGHPQIPDLYDFFALNFEPEQGQGRSQEFFYLVQEFIEGETLATELKNQGSLSVASVLDVLEQVLEILSYVHQNHSIHRDVKPSNLMRHPSGKIYLLDFGAVKQISRSGSTSPDWSTSIYSPGYAPPEQMSGGAVFTATDLYALGVTCLVLLTGQKPKKLLDSYDQAWHYRDYVRLSDRFAAILDRCLAAAPSDRFPSALEALEALRSVDRLELLEGACSWEPLDLSNTPVESRSFAQEGVAQEDSDSQILLSTIPPVENPPGDDGETGLMEEAPIPRSPLPERSFLDPTIAPVDIPKIPPFSPAPVSRENDRYPMSSTPAGSSRPTFSPWELLAQGAFTGFQGAFLAIVLSAIPSLGLRLILWLSGIWGLIWVQRQRWIEGNDLLILPVLELLVFILFPGLRGNQGLGAVVILLFLAACAGMAALALFRLVYQLLGNLF